ncbi:MAG TPA: hypothetical protein VN848_01740 [Gemmatimonadales bacterium]|nr:hypothetical protein [Gemmatimonadales bacterium]
MLSGFTIVRNAVRLDYPVVPAIRSLLEVCDEVVVNVGQSDDGTRELVAGIEDPRVRVLDTVWDPSRWGRTLAVETDRALAACHGPWTLYIQADEVLHETGAALVVDRLNAWGGETRLEGLLVDYLHFYGDVDTVVTNRHWYRREVRVLRLGRDLRSFGDAQGFRVGDANRRVRARATGAQMFHYGWARRASALAGKRAAFREFFTEHGGAPTNEVPHLDWTPGLKPFRGPHPRAAREWVAERRGRGPGIGPRELRARDVRYYVSDWIERMTGVRVFEYRNYLSG